MDYSFTCHGHRNVRSTHPTTLEFTKDKELTETGDCILGVSADFEYFKLREMLIAGKGRKFVFTLKVNDAACQMQCVPNPEFGDPHEIVLRKGDYLSARTLGTFCTKTARDIPREISNVMKDPLATMTVTITLL
ncbi:MAG: DUF371 domain-containing protein [Nanoarchaeota archaeon]|nr:DUF371 domain-containing protein [Nanoarchaeota archaeon]